MFHQYPMLALNTVLSLMHGCPGSVSKTHAGALAAKSSITESRAPPIDATSTEGASITGERAHLGIAVEIICPERTTLRLSVRRKAWLVERATDTRPATEASQLLRRHRGQARGVLLCEVWVRECRGCRVEDSTDFRKPGRGASRSRWTIVRPRS